MGIRPTLLAGIVSALFTMPVWGQTEPRGALQNVLAAHRDDVAYEVVGLDCRVPPPGGAASSIDWARVPHVIIFEDEATGVTYRSLGRIRIIADSNGALRSEWLYLSQGGLEQSRTRIEILTRNTRVQSRAIGAPEAKYARFEPKTYEEQVALRDQRHQSSEWYRATRGGYLELVRYVSETLLQASDTVLEATDDGVVIRSEEWGYSLTTTPDRWEVQRIRIREPFDKRINDFRFLGRLPEPIFPARHPRETRANGYIEGEPAENPPWITRFEIARLIDPPPAQTFTWQSVAQTALDEIEGTILNREGEAVGVREPEPPPSERIQLVEEASDGSGRWVPPSPPNTWRRLGLAASITCILVGAGLWLRRKLHG